MKAPCQFQGAFSLTWSVLAVIEDVLNVQVEPETGRSPAKA